MNTLRTVPALIVAVTVAVLPFWLFGCGTSQAPRLYTLNSMPLPAQAESRAQQEPPVTVGLGPVEIPDYLDQAQVVTRTSANQLSIAEFDLWGGSLKEDVTRVLLENLGALLRPSGMTVISWKSYVPCSLRVPVTIVRLDAVRGGNVSLRARWAVMGKDIHKFEALRETALTRPVKGNEVRDVVEAMSAALEALSREIASQVRQVPATGSTKGIPDK